MKCRKYNSTKISFKIQTFVSSCKYICWNRRAIPSFRVLRAHIKCVFATPVQRLPFYWACLRIKWQYHRECVFFISILLQTTPWYPDSTIWPFNVCRSILFTKNDLEINQQLNSIIKSIKLKPFYTCNICKFKEVIWGAQPELSFQLSFNEFGCRGPKHSSVIWNRHFAVFDKESLKYQWNKKCYVLCISEP
jgi:hypothetical protein